MSGGITPDQAGKLAGEVIKRLGQLLDENGVAVDSKKFAYLASLAVSDALEHGQVREEKMLTMVQMLA